MAASVEEVLDEEVAEFDRILAATNVNGRKQRCAPHTRLSNAVRAVAETRMEGDLPALDGSLDEVMHAAAAWRAVLGLAKRRT